MFALFFSHNVCQRGFVSTVFYLLRIFIGPKTAKNKRITLSRRLIAKPGKKHILWVRALGGRVLVGGCGRRGVDHLECSSSGFLKSPHALSLFVAGSRVQASYSGARHYQHGDRIASRSTPIPVVILYNNI